MIKSELQSLQQRAEHYLQLGKQASKSERRLAKDLIKLLAEYNWMKSLVVEQLKTEHPEFDADDVEAWLCYLKIKEEWKELFLQLADS